MNSLLPCPHCGSSASATSNPKSSVVLDTFFWFAYVVCQDCGAKGPELASKNNWPETAEFAANAWNARPPLLDVERDVLAFMQSAGQATPLKPTEPDIVTRQLRVRLIAEELTELAEAYGVIVRIGDRHAITIFQNVQSVALVEAYDAYLDLIYVVVGGAIAQGTRLRPGWEEVQASNMSKTADGLRQPDGKVLKGPSYFPANLAPIVQAQIDGSTPTPRAHERVDPRLCPSCCNVTIPAITTRYNPDECDLKCAICGFEEDSVSWGAFQITAERHLRRLVDLQPAREKLDVALQTSGTWSPQAAGCPPSVIGACVASTGTVAPFNQHWVDNTEPGFGSW